MEVYTNTINKGYSVLVNKDNICPNDLNFKIIDVNSRYAANRKAEETAFLAFKEFQKYALAQGYDIEIESGYRAKEYQEKVFNECALKKGLEHAQKYVAPPGYSEHQTGLALDICLKVNGKFIIENYLPEDFNKFLKDNAKNYGFILRYPKGKEIITGYNYEPWHIRYVGKELAEYIDSNDLTLEEYYEQKKDLKN